jgi:Fic family protein
LRLSSDLITLHQEAVYSVARLEGRGEAFRFSDLLVYASLSRESIASSTIEGTIASPEELALFQMDALGESQRVLEVANYNKAVRYGVAELSSRPISNNLVLDLHRILMTGVRGERYAGRFKEVQNFIGRRPGDKLEDALFVPSPPESVPRLMGELESYLNLPQSEPPLVKAALVHHQFETIHPFGDGNGRVGRLVILLGLIQDGLISKPTIYPSAYFERHRQDYYRLLMAVRAGEGWEEWLWFFIRGIQDQAIESLNLIEELERARNQVDGLVAGLKRRVDSTRILEAFFVQPVRTVAEVAAFAEVADNTARAVLEEMVEAGALRELTGRKRGRVYVCEPIWRAIFK